MAIVSVNGYQVYGITAQEMRDRGMKLDEKAAWFAEEYASWVEGAKKDQLSGEELQELKRKYSSGNLSEKESFALLGELVEAGVITKKNAGRMWAGWTPIDLSNWQPGKETGTIRKCDPDEGNRTLGSLQGLSAMLQAGGISAYENWLERAKATTNVDVGKSEYFMDCQQFLDILKELRMNA